MPLTPPVDREPMHRRQIDCHGYRRADGLFDIEGVLRDTKTYVFKNHDRGRVEPGVPVHEMWLRITVDDDMVIRDLEVATAYGPYKACPDAVSFYPLLKGVRIVPGFTMKIRQVAGGVKGCTHQTELLERLATVAYQTVAPLRARNRPRDPLKRPFQLNQCYAWDESGPVTQREAPEFYKPPAGA